MSEEQGKIGDPPQQQQQYGTFQGGAGYPSQPTTGFPQPVPPPGLSGHPPNYYARGYQAVPVVEGTPVTEPHLPCCGMGIGWLLFILGFFIAGIPWYFGAFIILCIRVDYREKPGLVACTISASLLVIAIIVGATKGLDVW